MGLSEIKLLSIHVLTESPEILKAVNEARLWAGERAQHEAWTGQQLPFGRPVEQFPVGQKPQEVCICKTQSQLRAYAEIHHNEFGWVVARMIVHPEHRGSGIGWMTLNHALTRIFTQSAVAHLFVSTDNSRALGLYQQVGFLITAHYPDDRVYLMRLEKQHYLWVQAVSRRIPPELPTPIILVQPPPPSTDAQQTWLG